MKNKFIPLLSTALFLAVSQIAFARSAVDLSPSAAYLIAQAAAQPVSAPSPSGDTANFNRTFQDAPLISSNGQYKLIGQNDGNLVIYKLTPSGQSPIWTSKTARGPGNYYFVFQGDGNLVIYSSGKAIWASNTAGKGGNKMVMQNDGNLVIYKPSGQLWASNSAQPAS